MRSAAADDATYLKGRDRVLGISINGVAHAYPIRILNYHEIVNNVIGGTSVVVTYCPLCGSGTAFEAAINGRSYEFAGEKFSVEFDAKHQTARVIKADGSEIPTTTVFWFAWYAFHPETEIYEAQ